MAAPVNIGRWTIEFVSFKALCSAGQHQQRNAGPTLAGLLASADMAARLAPRHVEDAFEFRIANTPRGFMAARLAPPDVYCLALPLPSLFTIRRSSQAETGSRT